MRHLGQYIHKDPASRNARVLPATNSSALDARRIVNLWERMIHLYGHRFSAVFGERAMRPDGSLTDVAHTWAGGLRGITGAQLAVGLRSCIESGTEWPPSLPAFRAMCIPERMPRCHQDAGARADLAYLALPRPPLAPEQREECLRRMRAALKSPTHKDEG